MSNSRRDRVLAALKERADADGVIRKATSPAYWALVRSTYPETFARMAALARELDVRLCRLNGERAFIDEIPADHPITQAIVPSCDFLCAIAETELA